MKHILYSVALLSLVFTSCTKEENTAEMAGQATVSFDAKVGSSDFALNQNFTIGNRIYNFKQFRYWVSNVSLVDDKGAEYKIPNSYFLLEETGEVKTQEGAYTYPSNKREDVIISNIPVGNYKTVKFAIGVDAKYNDNLSLQAGELSQLSGMTNISWMWHTSYIFSSITGSVTEGSTTKNIKAETGLNSNFKTVTIDLPSAVRISSAQNRKVVLAVDLSKVLNGIDLITTPTVGAAQATVMSQLATNYTQSISVVSAQ